MCWAANTERHSLTHSLTRHTRNYAPVPFAGEILHRAKHSAEPQLAPVPGACIRAEESLFTRADPNAALTQSGGKPLTKIWPTFRVPASVLLRAATSCAREHSTGEKEKQQNRTVS
jgi:hypothetical protein